MRIPVHELNLDNIILDLNELNQRCIELKSNSTFAENDVRTMIFALLSSEIQFVLLSVTLSKNLKEINFYEKNGYKIEGIDDKFREDSISQYLISLSNSYFILIYVQLENYIRLIATKKKICNFKIGKTIKNIKEAYGISDDNLKLLKLILNLRNSMHDGGFFNHQDDTINYKGQNFEFRKGEPILLGGIQFNIYLTIEIIENIIVELNENSKTDEFIEHNYANLKFQFE